MDRWIFSFGVFAVVAIAIIISSPILLSQNQQYIIDTINNSTNLRAQQIQNQNIIREQQFQDQKIALLDNITKKLDANAEKLEALIERQNITVKLDQNDTEELQESGKISGLGKPQIVG